MSVAIEQRKVIGVVTEASRLLADKGFNRGEMLLGLSELIGRIIVDVSDNSMQSEELYTVCQQHILKTIEIGSRATEKSIIERA